MASEQLESLYDQLMNDTYNMNILEYEYPLHRFEMINLNINYDMRSPEVALCACSHKYGNKILSSPDIDEIFRHVIHEHVIMYMLEKKVDLYNYRTNSGETFLDLIVSNANRIFGGPTGGENAEQKFHIIYAIKYLVSKKFPMNERSFFQIVELPYLESMYMDPVFLPMLRKLIMDTKDYNFQSTYTPSRVELHGLRTKLYTIYQDSTYAILDRYSKHSLPKPEKVKYEEFGSKDTQYNTHIAKFMREFLNVNFTPNIERDTFWSDIIAYGISKAKFLSNHNIDAYTDIYLEEGIFTTPEWCFNTLVHTTGDMRDPYNLESILDRIYTMKYYMKERPNFTAYNPDSVWDDIILFYRFNETLPLKSIINPFMDEIIEYMLSSIPSKRLEEIIPSYELHKLYKSITPRILERLYRYVGSYDREIELYLLQHSKAKMKSPFTSKYHSNVSIHTHI